jgi:hypothetical protein
VKRHRERTSHNNCTRERLLNSFADSQPALRATETIACIGLCIECVQTLLNPSVIGDEGILGWEVRYAKIMWRSSPIMRYFIRPVLKFPQVLALYVLALAFSLCLILGQPRPVLHCSILAAIALILTLLWLRHRLAEDGGDRLLRLTFVALAIASTTTAPTAREIVLFFLGMQLALAYVTAGISKLISRDWRSGAALARIIAAKEWGKNPALGLRLHRHRWLAVFFTYALIAGECVLPLMMMLPWPICLAGIALGVLFHTWCAGLLGLNNFVWAFLSWYPAILFSNGWVWSHI